MAGLGTLYNPSAVMMKQPSAAGVPYLGTKSTVSPAPDPNPKPGPGVPPASGVLSATANRATGPSSGYDPAYLQNLVTYGAGQFAQPAGGFNFNPTQLSTFPGAPTGGGNAPIAGMPNTLLGQAQGGQPFSWNVNGQAPAPGVSAGPQTLQDWLQQFLAGQAPTMGTAS